MWNMGKGRQKTCMFCSNSTAAHYSSSPVHPYHFDLLTFVYSEWPSLILKFHFDGTQCIFIREQKISCPYWIDYTSSFSTFFFCRTHMYNQIHLRYNNVGSWEIMSTAPPTLIFNQSKEMVWYFSKHKHQKQQLFLFLLAEIKYSKIFQREYHNTKFYLLSVHLLAHNVLKILLYVLEDHPPK